eukprot:33058-Heterocapsa_arctica.AAC.1
MACPGGRVPQNSSPTARRSDRGFHYPPWPSTCRGAQAVRCRTRTSPRSRHCSRSSHGCIP